MVTRVGSMVFTVVVSSWDTVRSSLVPAMDLLIICRVQIGFSVYGSVSHLNTWNKLDTESRQVVKMASGVRWLRELCYTETVL